jgi:Tol biopolymer transport system component
MQMPTRSQRRYILAVLSLLLVFHLIRAALPALALAQSPSGVATPTGTDKILFNTVVNDNFEIFVMDADGGNQTNLTNNAADDVYPAWSPDGSKIAFASTREDDDLEIYVMNADGSNPVRLTNVPDEDGSPAWSPDGSKIAFSSMRDGNLEIYVMDANGSNPVRLTNNGVDDLTPAWSPNGAKIAFTSNRDGNYEVYAMDPNGANQVNLTNNPADEFSPAWSPDSSKISFESSRDGNFEIYKMDANGANQLRLTNNAAEESFSTWSPDATKIAFTTNRNGNYDIYVMNADGSNQLPLANNPQPDVDPDWQRPAGIPSPTPTGTTQPTATSTPTATATASIPPPTPTPTATATPSVTATGTPTPSPAPAKALNISTRLRVQTGNNVLIGGFIVTGSVPKTVAVRGIGPSLGAFGVPDPLADPTLELRGSNGALIIQNDNWQEDPKQAAQLTALGLALQDPNESGLVQSLQPNAYTAVVAGKNDGVGVGLVEIYDADQAADSQLANISTRGFVLTGNNVMIGGFILGGGGEAQVAIRGIGPSLSQFVNPVLANPTLELHDGNGATLVVNDDWEDDPVSAAQLTAHGLAPQDPNESGIFQSLPPGAFTAVLAGKDGGVGIGLVEVYNLN